MKTAEEWIQPKYCLVQQLGKSGLFDKAEIEAIQQDALSSLQAMLPDAEVERIARQWMDLFRGQSEIKNEQLRSNCKAAIHSALALVRKNEDTEMLDWLEQHVAYINCGCDDEHETMWTLPTRGKGHDNGELRLAIREAMKK